MSTDGETNNSKRHEWIKSRSSFKIEDIVGITTNGMSSRFWMLRKHINMMDIKLFSNEKLIPFYAWECITVHLKNRDVDLVIRK